MGDTTNDSLGAGNVSITHGLNASGDVIFLPTDDLGTPGELNVQVLDRLDVDRALIPGPNALTGGYAFANAGKQRFCFVVTVGIGGTALLLSRNLRAALSDTQLSTSKNIWIPLMGTGAGSLSLSESHEIILAALATTGWRERPDVHITVAFPPGKETDTTQVLYDPAIDGALRFAAALANGRRQRHGQISTTSLFFALAESQADAAPSDLRNDRAASLFSGAVHSLAGQRFREGWDAYFSPDFSVPSASSSPSTAQFTDNVKTVLRQAADIALKAGHSLIKTDDLIVSLLNFPDGRHRLSMDAMGISPTDLLWDYRDALTGQIGKTLLNDVAAHIDRLGYDSYAVAIKDFLIDSATPPPLSVSIQAPWGTGKSSLMQQIRNKLDPVEQREKNKRVEPKGGDDRLKLRDVLAFLDQKRKNELSELKKPGQLWTVWFNAWKYDTSEQVWAGLVDAIVTQITERLKPVDRELFLLRLQLARIDDGVVRRKIYDRILTIWWGKVRAISVASVTFIASLFGVREAADGLLGLSLPQWVRFSPVIASMILGAYLVYKYYVTREKIQSEPASFSLAQYLEVPDYNRSLGTIHHIHQDLLRVLAVTPRGRGEDEPSPIVVFIDDLDRCSPSSIANVVEGVSMFLASEEYRCMFVIGMDPQLIAAALEDAHAAVRKHLPRYERTVPLGWRFMDKFIQLPFTIPPSKSETLSAYVDWLSGTTSLTEMSPISGRVTDEFPRALHQAPSQTDERPQPVDAAHIMSGANVSGAEEAIAMFKESRDVGVIIREAAKNTTGNPREIKRLTNLARLYLGLRNAARLRDPSWRSPNLAQYARWITLALRWPDMMRWLQWGADEGTWATTDASTELLVRRAQLLEDTAGKAQTTEAWTEDLVSCLNVPGNDPSDWACDHKLFEFFQAEAKRAPPERLSAAVAQGFW